MNKLSNKVCIVTGAARGIGEGIARKFASEGANVVIADLELNAVTEVATDIAKTFGVKTLGIAMDVSKEDDVNQGMIKVVAEFGRVDVLINNAGVQIISPFEEFEFADWKKLIDIHVHGSFLLSKMAMNIMKKGDGGTIIFVGSVHSVEASLKKSAYVAAKHAQLGMMRAIAKEGARYNIRSNLIAPGFVRTVLVEKQIPEQAKTLGISEEEVIKKVMLGNTVDGEFTTIDDVAEVALFFASFKSNALTGQSLIVSHGWHMQ